MSAAFMLLWGMRLACWPFEVEGHGADADVPNGNVAGPEIAAPDPATTTPFPPAPAPPVNGPLPASLPLFQEARYDIRYGIFGSIGALSFSVGGVATGTDGSRLVKVEGGGAGAVLGLGGMERRIEAEFDPVTLESRRWTVVRRRQGQSENEGIRDTAERGDAGALTLERSGAGHPPARQTVTFTVPTSDPLGLLWRLRTAPPGAGQTQTVHLLDGLALWRVRVTAAAAREILPDTNRTALRLEGDVAPIFYDGRPDPGRPSRRFTLWLSDTTDHLPLRLEVPVGLADVIMTLTETRTVTPGTPLPPPKSSQLTGPVPGARNL